MRATQIYKVALHMTIDKSNSFEHDLSSCIQHFNFRAFVPGANFFPQMVTL